MSKDLKEHTQPVRAYSLETLVPHLTVLWECKQDQPAGHQTSLSSPLYMVSVIRFFCGEGVCAGRSTLRAGADSSAPSIDEVMSYQPPSKGVCRRGCGLPAGRSSCRRYTLRNAMGVWDPTVHTSVSCGLTSIFLKVENWASCIHQPPPLPLSFVRVSLTSGGGVRETHYSTVAGV